MRAALWSLLSRPQLAEKVTLARGLRVLLHGLSSSLRTSGPLKWSEHEPAWLLGLSGTRQACVNVAPLAADPEPPPENPRPPPQRTMSLSRAWDSVGTPPD
jgi:hypothetical protein